MYGAVKQAKQIDSDSLGIEKSNDEEVHVHSTNNTLFIVVMFSIVVIFTAFMYVFYERTIYYNNISSLVVKVDKTIFIRDKLDKNLKSNSNIELTVADISNTNTDTLNNFPDEYLCAESNNFIYGDSFPNPPIKWSNLPEGTDNVMITMSSTVQTCCEMYIKYDWLLYNIPTTLSSIDTMFTSDINGGENGIYFGSSYDLDNPNEAFFHYVPPCLQKRQKSEYTFTIYALKESLLPYISMKYDESVDNLSINELSDSSKSSHVRSDRLIQLAVENSLIIGKSNLILNQSKYLDDSTELIDNNSLIDNNIIIKPRLDGN